MKSVLIVCEAGIGKGLGHFYRSLALAQILHADFHLSILSNNSILPQSDFKLLETDTFENFADYEHFDLLILDGYDFSANLISEIQRLQIPFIEISDFKQPLYPANYWLNSSMNAQNKPGRGLRYSLLRKEILEIARNRTFSYQTADSIFIAFGGTDEQSNSLKTAEVLLIEKHFTNIGVLYPKNGKDFEALAQLSESNPEVQIHFDLSANDLIKTLDEYAVCLVSSSTISCEMIALRKLVFTACLYDNQQLLHEQIVESGAALDVDLIQLKSNANAFVSQIKRIENKEFQEKRFQQQQKLIDGNAEQRIRTFISNCFE